MTYFYFVLHIHNPGDLPLHPTSPTLNSEYAMAILLIKPREDLLSVPEITANLYYICLSLDLR